VVDVYKKIIDACPYCGAMEMGMHTGIIDYRVACPICSATGPLHKDISTAISLWNTVSRSWYNQSLITHIPPAKEVSDETCDQLRLENDLLEEMISDRLGSLGELERGEDPGELGRGGDPGELGRGEDPGELERTVAPKKARARRRRRRGKRERGVSLETIIMATALKGIIRKLISMGILK